MIFSPPYILTTGWEYRTIFSPRGENIVTISSPPPTPYNIFTPLPIKAIYDRLIFIIAGVLSHPMSSSAFSLLTIFGEGVIISWHYIFTPDNIWWGGWLHFHSWQYLLRGWLHRDIIFSPLEIFGEGVIISWHYIFTPDNIWWGDDYIVTLHFQSRQYLVMGVIISWHYIFTPDNIWWGGDYIVTLHFYSWQYLVRGWLYSDITFSLLTIFGEGVIISWHYIFSPDNIWWGGDYIVT